MSEAAELIERLTLDRGMTQRQVAAALGRDPAIVSRVLGGKQSGASYVPFLRDLEGGRAATPPAHRTGRDIPERVMATGRGLIASHDSTSSLRRQLAASDPDRTLTLTIEGVDPQGKPWTRTLFPSGWRAYRFRAALDAKIAKAGYDPRGKVPSHVVADAIDAVVDEAGDHGYTTGHAGTGITTSYSVGTA